MESFGMFSSVYHIVLVVIGIGAVIAVHELGHFLAGLWAGAKIEKFAIGFGPRLFGFMWRGIDLSVRLLPLGGFVKYIGENPGESNADTRPTVDAHGNPIKLQGKYVFEDVPVGKRAVIAVAGVTMNFLFAIVCYAAALMIGLQVADQTVDYVAPGSAAETAGVQVGDRVVSVNGYRVIGKTEVMMEIVMSEAGKPMPLVVERNGESKELEVVPTSGEVQGVKGLSEIGVEVGLKLGCGWGGARRVGLEVNERGEVTDEIVAVNGTEVEGAVAVLQEVASVTDAPVRLTVRRGEQRVDLDPLYHYTVGLSFVNEPSLEVKQVTPDSPAEKAGLMEGDRIVGVVGEQLPTATAITQYINKSAGKTIDLEVKRGDDELIIRATPKVFPGEERARLGFAVGFGSSNRVEAVVEGSPADEAGIVPGDRIVRVLDLPVSAQQVPSATVESGLAFRGYLDRMQGKPLKLEVKRGDTEVLTMTLTGVRDEGAAPLDLGLGPVDELVDYPRQGPVDALVLGVGRSRFALRQVYLTLLKIVHTPSVGKGLGGPILIAQASYKSSQAGFTRLLWFMGMIGVNLAFLNLLPIPILDGGMLVFLGLEAVMKKRPPEKVLVVAQVIGLVLLLSLMAFVMYNDIARLIGGG